VINGIEEALNAIWQVDKSRSPGRKFMNYMALIIVCPLTINVGIGATTMLNTPAIAKHLDKLFPIIWVQGILFKILPIALLTITFVLFYYFLPNLKIRAKAAWFGGLSGALGLITLQKIFILLQVGVANYNAIYGSFATVPLFLLWIHSAWLVFLLGAEVAFTTEHFQNYHSKGRHLPPGPELALTFNLVKEIYQHFNQRREASLNNLAAATQESTIAIDKLLKRLVRANLIRVTDSHPPTYLPTTPAPKFQADEITSLLWKSEKSPPGSLGHKLAATFLEAGNQAFPDSPWNDHCQTRTETCGRPIPGGE
ncbi:YihY/virulence factor BrkB family protein, partial [bacterium]|nr:YihY/virulence factor BrkB family protein [bacterium]